MNKQEAIDKIKNIGTLKINDTVSHQQIDMVDKDKVLDIISQIDEPQKVVVPQFVADWYEEHKWDFEWNLYKFCFGFHERKLHEDLHEWFKFDKNKPIETLILMHKFGYEVEKEKRYTVEIPNPNDGEHPILFKKRDGKVSIIVPSVPCWRGVKNAQLTESEIKKDFAWAWQFAEEVEE
ncbi:DUF1642 domain-containing protein [Streptococcus macedonicus]|uniref:DUF1642 domain-containing protein n=1 Tax=Streptococcus macedonicus TaxID=59310 RepID=UPI00224437E0|nr:DUF1642 domain-containing protein [Streptococcus macedonicus]MCW8645233.1 DUF1642 domain-containing protein [Streptococcus macedonicus]